MTSNFTVEEKIENVTVTYNGELIVLNASFVKIVTLTSIDIADAQTLGISIEFGKQYNRQISTNTKGSEGSDVHVLFFTCSLYK